MKVASGRPCLVPDKLPVFVSSVIFGAPSKADTLTGDKWASSFHLFLNSDVDSWPHVFLPVRMRAHGWIHVCACVRARVRTLSPSTAGVDFDLHVTGCLVAQLPCGVAVFSC